MFLKERQTNGDFVSKVSDMLWRGETLKFADSETSNMQESIQQHDEVSVFDINNFECSFYAVGSYIFQNQVIVSQ